MKTYEERLPLIDTHRAGCRFIEGGSDMSNSNSSGGIGFTGLLAIVFVTLKLTGYIEWSWWWVLSPIWIPLLLVLVIVLVISSLSGGR